jgi:hypothetical protein
LYRLQLRHLERVPIGTPYPDVVRRVVEITRSPLLTGPVHLAVDNTGVGAAVMDLLHAAQSKGLIERDEAHTWVAPIISSRMPNPRVKGASAH